MVLRNVYKQWLCFIALKEVTVKMYELISDLMVDINVSLNM